MTREQQKKFRELDKYLSELLKKYSKIYKFKKKDFMIWTKKGDMYFSMHIYLRSNNGEFFCDLSESAKPIWLDELFWDIIDMPENKNENLSLRCIGAFAVSGAEVYSASDTMNDLSEEKLENTVKIYFEHFCGTADDFSEDDFYDICEARKKSGKIYYHSEIRSILISIHNKKYDEALTMINSLGSPYFENKGKTFAEYAAEYCIEKLSLKSGDK